MISKLLKISKFFLFLLIVLIALLLRKKDFAQIPIAGQSVDEYSYSWVGLSLIETGMPVGVSGIAGYEKSIPSYINVDRFFQTVSTGEALTINYPWMDHPPLLGLITGAYAHLSGVRVFEDTATFIIRKPIIIITTTSVALLMIYCWINFNFLTSVVAGLLYATTPLVVLSGRMIQAENAIIPCLLAVMICIGLYFKKNKDYWLFLAAFVSGVATLFKLSGVVCHLFVFFSLLNKNKGLNSKVIKDFGFFLAISLPISFLFVIYGAVYGFNNFIKIFFSNYDRFYGIGPNSIIELIRNQRLTQHKFLPESIIISGWFVFLSYLSSKKKNTNVQLVLLSLLSYLIVYIFFGSQPYGWYTFPFWPLLIILLSTFLTKGIIKAKFPVATLIILITILGANISRIINVFEFQIYANWWRSGVSAILLIIITAPFVKYKKHFLFKILFVFLFLMIIYSNIKYLNMINLDFWWQNIS